MALMPQFSAPDVADAGLSSLARGVIGSEILRIAGEIRALKAKGESICNLTVGDFDPAFFPVPAELLEGTQAALAEGHTNYPPSDGVLALREALVSVYERELGIRYPVESVLVAGGARPLLYGAYRTLLDPGELAVYAVPSWNNNHYVYMSGAKAAVISASAANDFHMTAEQLDPYLGEARTVCLNTPLNPTGTMIEAEELERIGKRIVEENTRRRRAGGRPLYLIFDQVYWKLTFGQTKHATPLELVPEIAPYTLMLDAISKSFCATGLRVGWAFMAPAVRRRMADILGHVGAWAPKPEQVATARLLQLGDATSRFQQRMKQEVKARLDGLYNGFMAMKQSGLPVDAIEPQGAIYLSARFDLVGKTMNGRRLASNEDIRRLLLARAGLAVVPFQAFGLDEDSGWFRLSVGAVSHGDIEAAFPRLRALLGEG